MRHSKVISIFPIQLSYQDFLQTIIDLAKKKTSAYVCAANAHMTVEAFQNEDFAHIVNSADFVTPDGVPVKKAIEWLYGQPQDRIAGMDFTPDLLKLAAEHHLKVGFYGSTPEILEKVTNKARLDFPELQMVCIISPPFRTLSKIEKDQFIEEINQAAPHLLFVALGCPKQEKWMNEHRGRVQSVMFGIGNALQVYAGLEKRAPLWMQKAGLEWAFRLAQEPRRLFKRYFYTNTKFIVLLLKQLFCQKILKKPF